MERQLQIDGGLSVSKFEGEGGKLYLGGKYFAEVRDFKIDYGAEDAQSVADAIQQFVAECGCEACTQLRSGQPDVPFDNTIKRVTAAPGNFQFEHYTTYPTLLDELEKDMSPPRTIMLHWCDGARRLVRAGDYYRDRRGVTFRVVGMRTDASGPIANVEAVGDSERRSWTAESAGASKFLWCGERACKCHPCSAVLNVAHSCQLDELGLLRGVTRGFREPDNDYRERIREQSDRRYRCPGCGAPEGGLCGFGCPVLAKRVESARRTNDAAVTPAKTRQWNRDMVAIAIRSPPQSVLLFGQRRGPVWDRFCRLLAGKLETANACAEPVGMSFADIERCANEAAAP